LLNAKPVTPLLFDKQIAFNLLPMAGRSEQQESPDVESEIAVAVRKLLGRSELNLSVRCCWVPVFFGHSQVVDMQFDRPIAMDRLRELLSSVADISLSDTSDSYPTAVTDASGKDGLVVGRIKSDAPSSTDFSLWTIADNLRFGIARNAVKSVEVLVKDYL
jgi:aspartate-semialdehyde dehydrogenase